MDDLLKALSIFRQYRNETYPTACEHDILYVCGYTKNEISQDDQDQLNDLGFSWDNEKCVWYSYKFGSA